MKTIPLALAAALALVPLAAAAQSFIAEEGADQWRASKLVGTDVLGPDGKKVGSVSDVLMGHDGHASAVVIGVGGFLGIGQKDVALPFVDVKFTQDPRPGAPATNPSDAAAGTPTEPGLTANSAIPVETPSAQGGTPVAALGGPVGTTTGVPGGVATGLASAPAGGMSGTAAPARSTSRPDHATVDLTADQLKAAPAFSFGR